MCTIERAIGKFELEYLVEFISQRIENSIFQGYKTGNQKNYIKIENSLLVNMNWSKYKNIHLEDDLLSSLNIISYNLILKSGLYL